MKSPQNNVSFFCSWSGGKDSLEEFIALGFKATIIVVNESKLDRRFLGKEINPQTVRELEQAGVDACGELGEYHTIVTGGPLFSAPLPFATGRIISRNGYCFLKTECV